MGEFRKLQQTPGGTFFVCVPKIWARQHNLERGAIVSITETSEGKLLIDSEQDSEPVSRIATLKSGKCLGREIIAKYLLGFDVVRVEGNGYIDFGVREIVKNTVRNLVGLEIVEEDHASIVLQCLLDSSGFPPEKILRRAYSIAAGMHRDVISALLSGDIQLAKSVIARDDESNRLYFLLVRILRTIVQNPNLSEKLGVSPIDCLDYRLAASLVESIGDECVRIAHKTTELKSVGLSQDLRTLFINFHSVCFESHEKALAAFLSGDITLAERVRFMRKKVEKDFSDFEEFASRQPSDTFPQILAAASFLRQIYEHSVDIADLAVPRKT